MGNQFELYYLSYHIQYKVVLLTLQEIIDKVTLSYNKHFAPRVLQKYCRSVNVPESVAVNC